MTDRISTTVADRFGDHFASLFEHNPCAVCLLDSQDRVFFVNDAFERLFGYKRASIEGLSLRGRIIPPGREREIAQLAEAVRQGQAGRIVTTRMRADKSLIQVAIRLFKASPAPDGDTLFCVYTDVQELTDTRKSLELARSQHRDFFEHAAEGIFRTTPEGSYIEVNPALAAIYGYPSPRNLIEGLSDISAQLYVDPGRREEFIREISHRGMVKNFESRVRRADGEIIWISENARGVKGPGGGLLYFEGTVTDVTARRRAEEALKDSRERYRSLVQFASDGIITLKGAIIVEANRGARRMFGYPRNEMLGLSVADVSPEAQPSGGGTGEIAGALIERALNWEPQNFAWIHKRKDGSLFHAEVSLNRFDARGETFLTAMVRDVTARKKAEEDLARGRAHLDMLFTGSPQAMAHIDSDGRIVNINPAFTRLFGYSRREALGALNRELIVPEHLRGEGESFNREASNGRHVSGQTVRRAKDGALVPVSLVGYPVVVGDLIEGIYFIYEDITERKNFENRLTHLAFHDSLTGLPNRALFMERLSRAMERSKRRPGYHFAVLLMDLDRFKRINDSLGHAAGDNLLKALARRLETCLRSVDTVARLGGDEFAILLEEVKGSREVIQVADRIGEALNAPFDIGGNEVFCGASVGIVLKTQGYEHAEDILRDSDLAMYRSKESGKDRLAFTSRMRELAVENLRMENELRKGLANGDLVLGYQPIVGVDGQRLLGFEALARWKHPVIGMIPPSRFIPLAEETGLILPLGEWALDEAMRQLGRWRNDIPAALGLFLTVNISSKQFRQPDLVERLRRGLGSSNLPPNLIKLEITESVIMRDAKSSADKLGKLKAVGVKLLIDDFGTGYSSLSYLQRFPIDGLKIDRSFVSGEGDEKDNLEIIRTVLALARNLGLDVVAEGVETPRQLESLKALGCSAAQGYLFAKPMDAKTAEAFIRGE
jgi:Amt family ammonium transporter